MNGDFGPPICTPTVGLGWPFQRPFDPRNGMLTYSLLVNFERAFVSAYCLLTHPPIFPSPSLRASNNCPTAAYEQAMRGRIVVWCYISSQGLLVGTCSILSGGRSWFSRGRVVESGLLKTAQGCIDPNQQQ